MTRRGSLVHPARGLRMAKTCRYVCKYRNRYFFVELNSMNAWYLPLNAVGGALSMIPLSGADYQGRRLLFLCNLEYRRRRWHRRQARLSRPTSASC